MNNIAMVFILAGILCLNGCQRSSRTTVTWAVGKDPTAQHQALADSFERLHPGVKVKLLEMPESSTAQHDAYVTFLASGDRTVDVYSIDIIWPAEFAQAGWLEPLNPYFTGQELSSFLPGPLAGCMYHDTLWAIPWFTDAGMLYYRSDILKESGLEVPQTWEQLKSQAFDLSRKYGLAGYVWQGQQYEGLVCNFLEVLWSHGGEIADRSGRPVIDSPETARAVKLLQAFLKSGASPRGVLTYKEEECRQLFTQGKAVFMRNWPYAWSLAQDTSKGSLVAGKVGMAPLPHAKGQESAACLGGWNLAVSRFSRQKELAVALVKFLTSQSSQKIFALKGGRLPTMVSVYQDAEVIKTYPHYRDFYRSFLGAKPRPVRPDYPRISDELQIGLHKMLLAEEYDPSLIKELQGKIEAGRALSEN
jgi:multiple sugar transport system substrate-binding protein